LLRVATHERHHVEIYRSGASRMTNALGTSTCANVSDHLGAIATVRHWSHVIKTSESATHNVLANGRVGSLEGRFVPDLNGDVTPVWSASQADDRARALAGAGPAASMVPTVRFEYDNGFQAPQVLVLFPLGQRYALAWGARAETRAREASRFYLDARDGTLLGRESVGWVDYR